MVSHSAYDGGEALRFGRFGFMNFNLDQSLWFCIFLQRNSTAWYRKREDRDLHFIRIMVKKQVSSSGETREKQDRSV